MSRTSVKELYETKPEALRERILELEAENKDLRTRIALAQALIQEHKDALVQIPARPR